MTPNQAKLDVAERSRTSLLPWRGQFSPELIEYVIDTFCPSAATIADPFCGSGTVLAEAMRRGRAGVGIDINPAAYVLSSFSQLLALSGSARTSLGLQASRLVSFHVAREGDLIAPSSGASIAGIIEEAEDPTLRLLLHISALVGCGDSKDVSAWKLAKGVQSVLRTLSKFEVQSSEVQIVLGDARSELARFSCDAIITSPPYINVFNYHQNYRPVMEHLGWTPLSCAMAEIGANRKHRQNRFLTVVQYCIDIALVFRGAWDALNRGGILVTVLGRESNVLRTAFYNSLLIRDMVQSLGIFSLSGEHERVFTNRYGAQIYEDILVFRANEAPRASENEIIHAARDVGIAALETAYARAAPEVRPLIEEAIAGGGMVKPSVRPELAKPRLWPTL